jgi:hypothetical protein
MGIKRYAKKLMKRNHLDNLGGNGRIILKQTLNKYDVGYKLSSFVLE